MSIASYYLDTPIFRNMTENPNFINTKIEDINQDNTRDDSHIVDYEDFIFTLSCLS
jgi:hypothetical protein